MLRVELASRRAAPRLRRPGNTAHCCIRQHPVLPLPLHLAHCLQTLGSHKQWLRPPAPVLISSPPTFLCRKNCLQTTGPLISVFQPFFGNAQNSKSLPFYSWHFWVVLSLHVIEWLAVRTVGLMHGNGVQHVHSILWERYRYMFFWIKNTIKYVRCL